MNPEYMHVIPSLPNYQSIPVSNMLNQASALLNYTPTKPLQPLDNYNYSTFQQSLSNTKLPQYDNPYVHLKQSPVNPTHKLVNPLVQVISRDEIEMPLKHANQELQVQIQMRDQTIKNLQIQLDNWNHQNNNQREAELGSLFNKIRDCENYIDQLEKENRNLQYELTEVANHLVSYKDRIQNFQKNDQQYSYETSDFLVKQIEKLTIILKQKNDENSMLQQQLQEQSENQQMNELHHQIIEENQELNAKVKELTQELSRQKSMFSAMEQGQQYISVMQERLRKAQDDVMNLTKQVKESNTQEQHWKQMYENQPKNINDVQPQQISEEKDNNTRALENKINTLQNHIIYLQSLNDINNQSLISQVSQPKTTKAKLQWKIQNKQ